MSNYNFYKAIKVAGQLAERANYAPLSYKLEAEAVDVILDLVKQLQEYQANENAKKEATSSGSISTSTITTRVPTWGGNAPATVSVSSLGYPKP